MKQEGNGIIAVEDQFDTDWINTKNLTHTLYILKWKIQKYRTCIMKLLFEQTFVLNGES
jgi:hypothetical protein